MRHIKSIWIAIMASIYIFIFGIMFFAKADILDEMTHDAQISSAPFIYQINWQRIISDPKLVRGIIKWPNSVFASITTIAIRLIVAISVTMLIYAWVRYILATWDAKEEWAVRQKIINTLLWVVIAMASIFLIYLAWSIAQGIIDTISTT